jgi:hypothetical protein
MASIARHSSIIALIWFSIAIIVHSADIHLSPNGIQPWPGSCSFTNCRSTAKCFISFNRLINTDDTDCNIHIGSGDYNSALLNFTNDAESATNIWIAGSISNLNMDIEVESTGFYVQGEGIQPVNRGIWRFGAANGNGSISSLQFTQTQFNLGTSSVNNISFSSCAISLPINAPFLTWASQNSVFVSLSQSTVYSPSNALFPVVQTSNIRGLSISDSSLTIKTLIAANYVQTGLIFARTQISLSADFITGSATNYSLEIVDSSVSSFDVSAIRSLLPTSLMKMVTFEATTFTAISMTFGPATEFESLNSTFHDCFVRIQSDMFTPGVGPKFEMSSIEISQNFGKFWLEAFPGAVPFRLHDLNITVDESLFESEPALLVGQDNFFCDGDSSIAANMLWLGEGTQLWIGNITVSNYIGLLGNGEREAVLRAIAPNNPEWVSSEGQENSNHSVWSFDSITTNKVILNASFIDTFHYRATKPSQGIVSPSNETSTIIFDPSFSTLVVSWVPEGGESISTSVWYPISSNVSKPPNQFETGIGVPSNMSMSTRFAVLNKTLAFSFSPPPAPLIPLEPYTCPEEPYPVGFICVKGVLTAASPVLPILILPPNSGVIEVYGNLSVHGSLVFDGLGTTLRVNGCLVATEVELDLTDENVEKLPTKPFILVIQSPECPNSLLDLMLRVRKGYKGCTRVKVKQDLQSSSQSVFSVVLQLDRSKCSIKWIIVGSVMGVVIVAMVPLFIWISKRHDGVRLWLRPYSSEYPRSYGGCCRCN